MKPPKFGIEDGYDAGDCIHGKYVGELWKNYSAFPYLMSNGKKMQQGIIDHT